MNSLPADLATKLNFTSIAAEINNFKNVSLLDVLSVHSSTKFLTKSIKYCYAMKYHNLEFLFHESRDNHPTYLSQKFKDSYVMQAMHSLSGEQSDLCLYTYSPLDLLKFLENNKQNHYTFLPVTVHATESANGYRHDMMLIFDNKTMLFYCFDGGNRTDYLHFGREIPKGALDVLFINMSDRVKTGYVYEPMALWMIQDVCQPSAFSNQIDFVMSTVWCYMVATTLDKYGSPTELLSILDTLSKEDLFHLLYTSMLNLIGAKYHPTINKNAQINLYDPIAPHPLDNIMSVPFPSMTPGVITAGVLAVNGYNIGNDDDSELDDDSETENPEFTKSMATAIELSKQEALSKQELSKEALNPLIQPFINFPDLNKKEEPFINFPDLNKKEEPFINFPDLNKKEYNFQRVVSSVSEATSEGISENTPLLNNSVVSEYNKVEPLSPLIKKDEDEHCNPM